jgi:hypothetical protein
MDISKKNYKYLYYKYKHKYALLKNQLYEQLGGGINDPPHPVGTPSGYGTVTSMPPISRPQLPQGISPPAIPNRDHIPPFSQVSAIVPNIPSGSRPYENVVPK